MKNKWTNLLNGDIEAKKSVIIKASLNNGNPYPIVVQSNCDIRLDKWIELNRDLVENQLATVGAILFTGFGIDSPEDFMRVSLSFGSVMMDYVERTSPRNSVIDKIYTSTEYAKDQVIEMHNELSYANNWPMRIAFCCQIPAENGGETPVADVRNVFNLLSDLTQDNFVKRGIKYVRNISPTIGLSWQQVYQTNDRAEVERFLAENGYSFSWYQDDHLHVEWSREAIVHHPITHEKLWFNHAYFYNSSDIYKYVNEVFHEKNIPFGAFYGDGEPIGRETIDEIKCAFQKSSASFLWRQGDVLLLDNMIMAHGRNAFEGNRKILVSMSQARF